MEQNTRLNKHLAHVVGISRREADQWIADGRVLVDGAIARMGMVVNPTQVTIVADGKEVASTPHQYQYILMNKPVGYVCSRKQQGDTPTIYQLLPQELHHLKVAGRLDKDSCGLLLLTDDGDTILKLTHPRFGKEKIYHVGLHRPLTAEDKERIESGIELEDGISQFTISDLPNDTPNMYQVIMSEGRNRQIRRTFGSLRYMVKHLERQSFGPYSLAQLNNERYIQITP